MRITRRQLRRIIREAFTGAAPPSGTRHMGSTEIGKAYPVLAKFAAHWNGVIPQVLSKQPEVMEIMQSNPDDELYAMVLSIIQTYKLPNGMPLPFLPFGFERVVLKQLVEDGLDPELARTLQYRAQSTDNEYSPPGW